MTVDDLERLGHKKTDDQLGRVFEKASRLNLKRKPTSQVSLCDTAASTGRWQRGETVTQHLGIPWERRRFDLVGVSKRMRAFPKKGHTL